MTSSTEFGGVSNVTAPMLAVTRAAPRPAAVRRFSWIFPTILFFCFRNDKSISIWMRFDPTDDQIHLRWKAVAVSSNPNNLSLLRQIPEVFSCLLPLLFLKAPDDEEFLSKEGDDLPLFILWSFFRDHS
jgi:hypothetical protein